jgi:hypothetical protein
VRSPTRGVSRLVKVSGALALIAMAAAALAMAATPKAGAYFGHTKVGQVEVEFSVPPTLGVISDLTTGDIPQYCEGGGVPAQTLEWGEMKIKGGKFSGKVAEKAEGKVIAHGMITGKFLAGGKVTGTLKSTFTPAISCDGQTTFTAKTTGGA